MRLLMREHLLLVTWLLWLQTCRDVGAQNVCPHSEPRCQVSADQTIIFSMKCTGYGALVQIPAACTDTRIVSNLVIGQGTDTSVGMLQNRILDGLRVRQLELAGLGIRSISVSAFEAISSDLQVLYLQDNQLESLPVGVFRTLVHLSRLQLHNNRLTQLADGVFSGLTNLVYLTLNANRISAVDHSAWQALPRLVTLILENNRLGEGRLLFPDRALDSLEELRLDRNGLAAINDDITSALPNLRRLYFRSNRVNSLPSSAFRNNPRLEILDLSANNISQLTASVFNESSSLVTLVLDENRIQQLPDSVFLSLNSLRILRMRDNKISDVYSNSFTGLVGLRELDLSENRIPTLPLGMFDPLGLLETLSLANNKIRQVEKKPFQSCRNLRTLDMVNNLLPGITADWFVTTTQLTFLKLAHNLIESIEAGSFDQLQQLRELDLRENYLSDLGINLFSRCRSLQKLNLARNPFREFASPGTTFFGLQALRQLDLTGCCITELVLNSSAPLPALTELYLGNNLLTELSRDSLEAASRLQRLDLTDNSIAAVEAGALSSLASLNWLNLSRNLLTGDQLAAAVQSIPSGVIVDASRNRIKSIASLTIPIRGIYLSGNPLVCSCTSPSWISLTDTSRFLDASKTLCSSGNEQAYLLCYWSRCGTSSDHPLCDAAIPRTTNSSTANVPSKICRLDAALVVFGPRFIYFEALVLSSTSARLGWNISDEFSTAAGFHLTFSIVENCTNVSAAIFSLTGNETRFTMMHDHDHDLNGTTLYVGNLTSGQTYVTCAHVLQKPTGISNRTSVSDTECACLQLPNEPTTTTTKQPTTTTIETTTNNTPTVDLLLWTTRNDSTILVTWTMKNSIYEPAYFWLICFDEENREVMSADVEGHSYVIKNLSEHSTYNVCVTAVTRHNRMDLTRCVTVQTDQSPGPTINIFLFVIVAVSVGCLLLALIIVVAIVVARRRRRRQRKPTAAEMTTSSTYDSSTGNGVRNGKTVSGFSSPLSEQAVTTMNMYDGVVPSTRGRRTRRKAKNANDPLPLQSSLSLDIYDESLSY